jgi:hypothetical protein
MKSGEFVQDMVQERVSLPNFEDAKIAVGICMPVGERTAEDSFSFIRSALSCELKVRLAQIKGEDYSPTPTQLKDISAKIKGAKIVAGLSRLVSTKRFENWRTDPMYGTEVRPGETLTEAFDRAFRVLGEHVQTAIHDRVGKEPAAPMSSGEQKSGSFTW